MAGVAEEDYTAGGADPVFGEGHVDLPDVGFVDVAEDLLHFGTPCGEALVQVVEIHGSGVAGFAAGAFEVQEVVACVPMMGCQWMATDRSNGRISYH